MNRRILALLLLAAVLLSGCSGLTVDEMYCLPRRSEDYNDLQSAIDKAMTNLEYCAPLAGENQQTVQMADLDGDGLQEYLLFAKGTMEKPLRILIFDYVNDSYLHTETIECNGSAFDLVEYVQMDDAPGMEIVVGRQLSDQVLRSVSVYTLIQGEAEQLLSVNYTEFLTLNMDDDDRTELFVLCPGQSDADNGIAVFYGVESGAVVRSNEADMSAAADKLKRVVAGKLHGGETAVYAASAVGDTAIITDVYALVDDKLTNVTFSNESGTSVQTIRNYYVYADDIDDDGVMELPCLINMSMLEGADSTDKHDLIRWYAMTADGKEVDKMHTFHNFVGGWYIRLDSQWAERLTVQNFGNRYEFYLWDKNYQKAERIMTIFAFAGQNREEQGTAESRFILYRTESVVYAAKLEAAAGEYDIYQQTLVDSFRLIHQDWKTGET